jgi:hypothetical protein
MGERGKYENGDNDGEPGKSNEMKNRKANLDALEPDTDKPESPDSPESTTARRTHTPHARLGREVQAQIGQQLRDMYGKVVKEGVPQHIADLVHRLSEQE